MSGSTFLSCFLPPCYAASCLPLVTCLSHLSVLLATSPPTSGSPLQDNLHPGDATTSLRSPFDTPLLATSLPAFRSPFNHPLSCPRHYQPPCLPLTQVLSWPCHHLPSGLPPSTLSPGHVTVLPPSRSLLITPFLFATSLSCLPVAYIYFSFHQRDSYLCLASGTGSPADLPAAFVVEGGCVIDPVVYLSALWTACLQKASETGSGATLLQTRVRSLAALEQSHGPFHAVVAAAGAAMASIEELSALPCHVVALLTIVISTSVQEHARAFIVSSYSFCYNGIFDFGLTSNTTYCRFKCPHPSLSPSLPPHLSSFSLPTLCLSLTPSHTHAHRRIRSFAHAAGGLTYLLRCWVGRLGVRRPVSPGPGAGLHPGLVRSKQYIRTSPT